MREAHRGFVPLDKLFEGGVDRFFNKGGGGRWRGVLTDDEVDQWRTVLAGRVDANVGDWFEQGSLALDARPEDM